MGLAGLKRRSLNNTRLLVLHVLMSLSQGALADTTQLNHKINSLSLNRQFEIYKESYLKGRIENLSQFEMFYKNSQKQGFKEGEVLYILGRMREQDLSILSIREEAGKKIKQLSSDLEFIKTNRFLHGLFLFMKGAIFLKEPNYQASIQVLEEAASLYDGEDLNTELASIYFELADALAWSGNYEKALALVGNNIRTYEHHKFEMMKGNSYNQMGTLLGMIGRYAESNDYLFKALELHKKYKDITSIVECLDAIAFNKSDLQDHEQAIKYRLEAISYFDNPDVEPIARSNIFSNIGASYHRLGNREKVKFYLSKAIRIDEENAQYNSLILKKSNYAALLGKEKRFQQALKVLSEVSTIDQKYWDDHARHFYHKIATRQYQGIGNFKQAENHFKKALRYTELSGDQSHLKETYFVGVELYREMGKINEALEFQRKYFDMQLQAEKEKSNRLFYSQENKFLENEYLIKGREARTLRYLLLFSIVVFGVIFVLIKISIKKTKLLHIERLNSEIRTRSLLDQMQPHFLFNCLNIISNLVHESADKAEDAINRLSDLYRLILQSSKLYTWHLSKELELIEDYLELLVLRLGDKIRYSINYQGVNVETVECPCLMLHTLVENGIKHGISLNPKGGELTIDIRPQAGGYRLAIVNTGSGEIRSSDKSGTGTGLENTKKRLVNLYGSKSKFQATFGSEQSEVTFWIPKKAS